LQGIPASLKTRIACGIPGVGRHRVRCSIERSADRIVRFTDRLNEAENADGDDFGDDRLVETVVLHREQPAALLLDTIFNRVREFTGGRFSDDATLITIAIR
jgi:serine phosphatase RsbU (regulator of sigma subunit)